MRFEVFITVGMMLTMFWGLALSSFKSRSVVIDLQNYVAPNSKTKHRVKKCADYKNSKDVKSS
jgi:hypothetical protein